MTDGIPLDADARERRQQLERIAFGRTHGPEDEAAASAARQELAEVAGAAQVAARERANSHEFATGRPLLEDDLGGQGAPPNPDVPPPPPPELQRTVAHRLRRAWLVPIIVCSVVVGYYGAPMAVAGMLQDPPSSTPAPVVPSPVFPTPTSESPTPEPPSIDGVSAGQPSSLKEADAWFETLPRNSDALLDPDVAGGLELDPTAIRFVQSSGAEFQVWVARKLDGDLCVVGSEAEGVSAFAGCNTREGFARSGVTMSHGGYSMIWNGSSVTVTMPRPVVTR
jgi:hypothetical protein